MAGVQVTPRLRLVRPIGEGGMGTVWVAYHETLRTEVAVKLIHAAVAESNPKMLQRFEREAGISAQLKSPHVAQTFDHGMLPSGMPYIVMELLQGQSLSKLIKRAPLTLHHTALVLGQTAQALAQAHRQGIVHRDIKPANLFCVETDYPIFIKLLDFGIAKHVGRLEEVELTNTSHLLGSPLYMSPEQFTKAKSVDWRCDLWSLAVVAYRCLAQVPPFQGDALGNVIMAVMQHDYQPISRQRPGLPDGMDGWFERAFHPDIRKRFQSAKQLAESFADLVASAAAATDPPLLLPSITDAEPRRASIAPSAPAAGAALAHAATLPATPAGIAPPREGRVWRLAAAAAGLLLTGAVSSYALLSPAEPTADTSPTSQAATSSPPGETEATAPADVPHKNAASSIKQADTAAAAASSAPFDKTAPRRPPAAPQARKPPAPPPPSEPPPAPEPPPPAPNLRDQAGF